MFPSGLIVKVVKSSTSRTATTQFVVTLRGSSRVAALGASEYLETRDWNRLIMYCLILF